MTVLEFFMQYGIAETKVDEIYNGQNKIPSDEARIDKKAMITCPSCKSGIKIKPQDFVLMGCPKCGYKVAR